MFRFIKNLLTGQVTCNECGYDTPKDKAVVDSGYDDWGHQCLACAKETGLLARIEQRQREQDARIERRKAIGL